MKPKQLFLGAHVSFKKPHYLVGSIKEALSYQANTLMIYLGAPQNTARVDPSEYQTETYLSEFAQQIPPENIVVHAPYIVNPASAEKAAFARDFIVSEIERMNSFGACFLVLHPGAYTSQSREAALLVLETSLREILRRTTKVEILLETMAGKGTELGTTLSELAQIIQNVGSDRLGVCLDTCHMWDAGYNLQESWTEVVNELETLELLPRVKVMHINDSKNVCGAHKDRHANIGQGQIGLATLRQIVHEPKLAFSLKILETPYIDDEPPYGAEIKLLLEASKPV